MLSCSMIYVTSTSDDRACLEEYYGHATYRCTQITKTLIGTESTGSEKESELNNKANNKLAEDQVRLTVKNT